MVRLRLFEDFLTDTQESECYSLTSKDKIKRGTWDKITIAKNYINIIKVSFFDSFSNGVNLEVLVKSPDTKIEDEMIIKVLYAGEIIINEKELFESVQSSLVADHEKEALKLFEKYLKFGINLYLHDNPCVLAKCGWISLEKGKAFLSVNCCNRIYPDIVNDLFNGCLEKIIPKKISVDTFFEEGLDDLKINLKKVDSDFENFCLQNEYLKKLFSLILSDSCMLTVFSYSIHSLFWGYLRNYNISQFDMEEIPNKYSAIFSLCIYGKDPRTSKIIANLLANFFTIPNNKWATIYKKYHISSTSLSSAKFDRLPLYKSIPIIVTAKTNHFTRASSIIKKIHQKREDSWLHCYPVYISDTPVIADEIVNCCSDFSVDKLKLINYDLLNKIHTQLCYLLYHFICYLTKISNSDVYPNREDEQYFSLNIYTLIENLYLTEEWLDNHVPNYLLYSTMDCFCYYLKSISLSCYADELKGFSKECFLPNERTEEIPEHIDESHQDFDNLYLFYQFIHKNLATENGSWIWEGKERRGKEDCYYLSSVVGYKKFNDFIKKERKSSIAKEKFIKLLKTCQMLKESGSERSNSMKRKNLSGELVYVLVLLKDKLDSSFDKVSV